MLVVGRISGVYVRRASVAAWDGIEGVVGRSISAATAGVVDIKCACKGAMGSPLC